MIVVDTNLLLYASLSGPYTALAQAVRARDPEWASPALWRDEMLNALAGYVRRGEVTVDGALTALEAAGELVTRVTSPRDRDVLDLVTTSRCSAYDLEFVALARSLGVPLVTNDKQVLDAFPGVAVAPDVFAPDR